jgi:uncharacterized OB-fold protein
MSNVVSNAMDDDALLPIPDAETEAFWRGLADGVFLLRWCLDCGRPHYYPRSFCPLCWSERVEWRPASGQGRVFATTVIRQMGLPPFDQRVPYNVALVELDEGPLVLTNVVGAPPESVVIGAAVELAAERHRDIALPLFRLRAP